MKMVFEVFLVFLLAFVGSYLFCNITGLREVPETTLVTAISLMLLVVPTHINYKEELK